ncbi:MAG: ATP-dependent zinc metalloprotease FtsH [Lentisphaeria bacterium]|nr:ATP-dependent zinc metalloprotease FtsH [Lentisphaeria bacterium]
MLLLWAAVIFAIPLFLVLFNGRESTQLRELRQSEFEELLKRHLIRKVTIEEQSSGGVIILEGEYWPTESAKAAWNKQYGGAIIKQSSGGAEKVQQADSKTTTELKVSEPVILRFKSRVVYTDMLDQMIREHCEIRDTRYSSGLWTNIMISVLPILLMVGLFYFMFARQMRGAGNGALQFGKSRARMLNPGKDRLTLKDVAGIDEAKEEMQEIVDFLKDPAKFRRLGGKIPRGVLMVGPPGTGKTLLAKAIAGEADVPFFSISGSDFVEMFVGVGASRVRDMFEEGKKHSPCLIFIDEIDAVGRSRFSGIGGGHDEREQTLNALLVEMDGFEVNSGVIVIAATNRPDVLDPALLRPGRFDRQIVIDLPDLRGRLGILKIHAAKIKLAPDVDLKQIARGTTGFSGADLANLINEAALIATRTGKEAVTLPDLEEARDKVCFGKERRSRKVTEKDRKLTAYHEGGHALVNMLCEHTIPLHKITIIPRGQAGGMTMFLPEQDLYHRTFNELRDSIAVALGGRAAEELVLEDISTGASADIRQATETAKKMVCQYGMSRRMGPVNYIGREEHIFLGRDITRSEDFSPETAREIDLEIRGLVEEGQKRAVTLLKDNLDKLHKLAQALLERETMTAQEVYELLEMEMPEHAAESDDDFGPETTGDNNNGGDNGGIIMAQPPLEPEDPPTGGTDQSETH